MANADAFLRVTRGETWFTPPGIAGFIADDHAYRAGRPEAAETASEVQNAHTRLDARGTATLSAPLSLPAQHGPEIVTAEANVTDLSRQTIAGSTTAVV